jgi:FtsP/CotA-like multicopper oxidase with cupredoxin domain
LEWFRKGVGVVRSLTRRQLLVGAAGIAGTAGLAGAAGIALGARAARMPAMVSPTAGVVGAVEAARRRPGAGVVTATLRPRPVTVDLGGPTVATWGYDEAAPGPLIRARAGDLVRVEVTNALPASTSVHWHGVALRNDMDGVPGLTQRPIEPGGTFRYEFTAPDPGTYFYHPHSGVQLDRALYGVLIVDDAADPGRYDQEWVVVLDDWVDGTGRTPDQILDGLSSMGAMMHGGMTHGGMETNVSALLGGAGDVTYPHYLINGRVPAAPVTLTGRPGQRVRIRMVNAASDTAFRLAIAGHRMTVTHTDGFPVVPTDCAALLVGMGERIDVVTTLADGVFPLVAAAEGKTGQAMAVVRTAAGTPPAATAHPTELDGQVLLGADLRATEAVRLADRKPQRTHRLTLGGAMMPYRWTINATTFDHNQPLLVGRGERVRLRIVNDTDMFHPMHLHGHTFAVAGGGARKDTVVVRARQRVTVDFDATNPGRWMVHCHNAYHAEAGMMTLLGTSRDLGRGGRSRGLRAGRWRLPLPRLAWWVWAGYGLLWLLYAVVLRTLPGMPWAWFHVDNLA